MSNVRSSVIPQQPVKPERTYDLVGLNEREYFAIAIALGCLCQRNTDFRSRPSLYTTMVEHYGTHDEFRERADQLHPALAYDESTCKRGNQWSAS